jgi:Phage integrase, N-terminal SAM-like domain
MSATASSEGHEHRVRAAAGSGLDVGSYLQRWLAHARGRVRAVACEGYEALLRCHAQPRIGHLELRELRPLDIQNLYGELLAGSAEARALGAGVCVLDLRKHGCEHPG